VETVTTTSLRCRRNPVHGSGILSLNLFSFFNRSLPSALIRALSGTDGLRPGALVATHYASPRADVPSVSWERLDLADPTAADILLAQLLPAVVVHTALPRGSAAGAAGTGRTLARGLAPSRACPRSALACGGSGCRR